MSSTSNEEIDGLTDEEVNVHFIITRLFCVLGFIPNCILVLLIILRKKFQNSENVLAFQLSIACIFFIFSYCFPKIENKIVDGVEKETFACKLQMFINVVFDLMTMLFTLCIACMNYYMFILPEKTEANKKKILKIMSIVSWVIPLLYGIFCVCANKQSLGSTKICWPRSTAVVLVFTILIIGIFIMNMFYVIRLLVLIKRSISGDNYDKKYINYFWHLIWYILAQLVTHIPFLFDIIRHAIARFSTRKFSDVLWEKLLRDISKTITGLLFAFVYCFTLEKWDELKKMFCCIPEMMIDNFDYKGGELEIEDKKQEEDSL